MVIPNIILLCDIIYNLEISQSAKKTKLLKINLPINKHDSFLKKKQIYYKHILAPPKKTSINTKQGIL